MAARRHLPGQHSVCRDTHSYRLCRVNIFGIFRAISRKLAIWCVHQSRPFHCNNRCNYLYPSKNCWKKKSGSLRWASRYAVATGWHRDCVGLNAVFKTCLFSELTHSKRQGKKNMVMCILLRQRSIQPMYGEGGNNLIRRTQMQFYLNIKLQYIYIYILHA